jgi:hypothetical protein
MKRWSSFGELYPRGWLRGLIIGAAVTGFLWMGTMVASDRPNGALTLLVGLLLLPIGVATVRNLDGMAQAWGRQFLFRQRGAVSFWPWRPGNSAVDEAYRDRVEAVRQEGGGRLGGGILIMLSLGWIAGGIVILTGVLHN